MGIGKHVFPESSGRRWMSCERHDVGTFSLKNSELKSIVFMSWSFSCVMKENTKLIGFLVLTLLWLFFGLVLVIDKCIKICSVLKV